MLLFLRLIEDLSRSVMSEWLCAEDVSRLDVAYCNRKARPLFLKLMKNTAIKNIKSSKDVALHPAMYLSWLLKRSLKPAELVIPPLLVLPIDSVAFFGHELLRCVRKVHVSNCEHLPVVLTYAVHLQELSIRREDGCEEVPMLPTRVLPCLQKIKVSGRMDGIEDALHVLASFTPNLTQLDVHGTSVGDSEVAEFLEHCPKLASVDCSFCPNVTNALLALMPTSLPHLQSVKLLGAPVQLFDVDAAQLVSKCAALSILHITAITDSGLIALAGACPQLTHLSIADPSLLTDRTIITLARNCPLLTDVFLRGRCGVTDTALTELAVRCKNLRRLGLTGCVHLTAAGIGAVVKNSTQLAYLSFPASANETGRMAIPAAVQVVVVKMQ
jgi:hypothetical protein